MKKNNILSYVFICIIINMIPISLLGVFNISDSIYTILNAIAYMLEILIMIYAVRNNIKKVSNKKVYLLLLFLLMQIIVQIINYFNFEQYSIQFQEVVHILSVIVNIFVFIICTSYSKVEKEDIIKFMKKMVYLGVLLCCYNIIINATKILNISNIISSYSVSFSSIFPNRNQFGLFLITMILSNLYIKQLNKNFFYKFVEVFFIINLVLTMSRNSIIGMISIYIIKFYLDCFVSKKISKKKILIVSLIILTMITAIIIILNNNQYMQLIDRLFIRSDTLETGSGRTQVWKNGIEMVVNNNIIIGIGRFNAIRLNKTLYNSKLDQFHSIYIETFVTYGLTGLIILFVLFKYIMKRIKRSSLDLEYKNILITSLFVFMIISIFETTTRFAIGYADIMNMVYFIVIPIILTTENKEELLEEENTNIKKIYNNKL